MAEGISLPPHPGRPLQLLLQARLCEKRLANIDSSGCIEEIKEREKEKNKEGISVEQCHHEWFIQHWEFFFFFPVNLTSLKFNQGL